MNFEESCGIKKQFEPDMMIFEEGDPSDYMYIVISGKVQIFKTIIQKAIRTLHVVEENGCFGEMSLFTGSKRTASAKVIDVTEVFQIDKSGLYKLLKSKPEFAVGLMEQMSERLQNTSENLIYSELELALSRHKPVRFEDSYSNKILFEVVGMFSIENKNEVAEIANTLIWPDDVDVIASLFKPGINNSLIYVVAVDNISTVLNVTARFKNLVNWEFSPVLSTNSETLTI